MKGNRSLTDEEIKLINDYFDKREADPEDTLALRDRAMFFMGLYTGFRISELLSIRIGDVWIYNTISQDVYLKKENTKKKVEGRCIPLSNEAKKLLYDYIKNYSLDQANKESPLFPSVKGGSIKPRQAHNIFTRIYKDLKFTGHLACHSTRKTFANRIISNKENSIIDLKQALGHKSISSTECYIQSDNAKVKKIITDLTFKL